MLEGLYAFSMHPNFISKDMQYKAIITFIITADKVADMWNKFGVINKCSDGNNSSAFFLLYLTFLCTKKCKCKEAVIAQTISTCCNA